MPSWLQVADIKFYDNDDREISATSATVCEGDRTSGALRSVVDGDPGTIDAREKRHGGSRSHTFVHFAFPSAVTIVKYKLHSAVTPADAAGWELYIHLADDLKYPPGDCSSAAYKRVDIRSHDLYPPSAAMHDPESNNHTVSDVSSPPKSPVPSLSPPRVPSPRPPRVPSLPPSIPPHE
eukprot:2008112-Prymnesium_polylepis.1